ncbi:glycosyltransferase family 9 protein [Kamptonema cortianum]|nr:glycosyltransferase family 9 protein [Oscillatoria laete-virens]MDK3156453.1 glycosyltransferase family 9 protein [Kamptonema cortianum]MDL5053865.1 glycosyltransferase family 9 protein [Oscillatoria laete-virens NRMC-F 0139]
MKIPGRDTWVLQSNLLAEKWGFKTVIRDRTQIREMARESILVVVCTALGDAILCTPLLRKLRGTFPGARIGFLVKKPFVNLFEHHGHGIQVHSYTKKYVDADATMASLMQVGGYKVALLCNANDPDVVPLLHKSGTKAFLRRPTRDSAYRSWMANPEELRRPTDPDYATGHAIIQNLKMTEWLGAENCAEADYPTEVFPTGQDTQFAQAKLPPGSTWIGIHPGASREFKRWPVGHFRELIGKLRGQGCRFVITGSPEEKPLAAQITQDQPDDVINLCGELSLRQLAALMRQFSCFVSGDTGPYHLAMAMDCPTVTWFAPSDKGSDVASVGPLFHQEKHLTIRPEGYSQPMSTIPAEAVLKKINSLDICAK